MPETKMKERVLQPGQIVHIHGIPVELKTQVIAATAPGNWTLIQQEDCRVKK